MNKDARFNTTTLRINNERSVLHHIYQYKKATPLSLHEATSLSRPTIAHTIKKLLDEKLIYLDGLAESTGGRKANRYAFQAMAKIAVGLEIYIDYYEMAAIDLYGTMLKYEKRSIPYRNEQDYYDSVCQSVEQFIEEIDVPKEDILGVGIALQALISEDGSQVIYGKILGCTGLKIVTFSDVLPYLCTFNHDAESAANVELHFNASLKNAIFLNIGYDVSGAIIINRKFFKDGVFQSGLFEHMTLIPDGRPCYCEKRGCLNAYCSMSAFLKKGEDPGTFFTRLRNGEEEVRKRWNEYLEYLGLAIDNLHMAMNMNIILGGFLSRYLVSEDLDLLHGIVKKRTAFPLDARFISISKCANTPSCIGAALPLIREFLHKIM